MEQIGCIRSALFVDFDNIFIGLKRQQAEAAELFGTKPDRWVDWLEQDAPSGYRAASQPLRERRILVRRCYINPRSFQVYRPHFIRSGFEVVDCPPLTSQGKTSADIHMVIDMLDALAHSTRFDEFIVLSGDADFTPVLLRLRKHDRRTITLAIGPASPAYKASSDHLIDEGAFLEKGLGIETEDETERRRVALGNMDGATQGSLRRIAQEVEKSASITGRLEAVELPRVYKGFPEFVKKEDWLGFFSLRAMTEAVVEASSALELIEDDPWSVGFKKDAETSRPSAELPDFGQLASLVKTTVAESSKPVVLATLAHEVTETFGEGVRTSSWLGSGSFKGLIDRLDLGDLRLSQASPGYVFHPHRHEKFEAELKGSDVKVPKLSTIAERVSMLTGMPAIPPLAYAMVLEVMAKEINTHGYHLTRTSKAVRDRCAGKGIAVSRASVGFILKAIAFTGYHLGEGEESPLSLGRKLFENTLDLCARAQIDIGSQEHDEIRAWLLGQVTGVKSSEWDA